MLLRDETYTVKVKSARFFNFTKESEIRDRAASLFSSLADVTSVERPLGTQYYLIRLTMKRNGTEQEIAEISRRTMNAEGFDNAEVLYIERGTTSTNVLREAAKETAAGIAPIISPLSSYAVKALGVATFGAFLVYIIITRKGNK